MDRELDDMERCRLREAEAGFEGIGGITKGRVTLSQTGLSM